MNRRAIRAFARPSFGAEVGERHVQTTIMMPSTDPRAAIVGGHLQEGAAVKLRTAEVCLDAILAAADLIAVSFRAGGKLLLCGNGGSAADCQHLAAEFTSRLSADFVRPGLPALALTTDTSFLTAYANDFNFEGIFARQVQALGKPGDVLLGISTSGRSKNVIRAAETAKEMGMKVVVLTGAGGRIVIQSHSEATPPSPPLRRRGNTTTSEGKTRLVQLADVAICVPSDNTQHIQEAHLAVEHIICHLVERALFGEVGS